MKKILLSLLVLTVSTAMMANKSVTMSLAGKGVSQKEAAAKVAAMLGCQNSAFETVSEREDQMGMTHISLQQTFSGAPINGAMIFVHCKGGAAVSMNGQYVSDAELPQPVQAISKAKARSKAGAPRKAGAKMVIVEAKDGAMRWAYETVSLRKLQKAWIDAETGEVLRTASFRHNAGDVKGTAETLYMGNVPMTSVLTAEGDYVLFDEGRRIYTYDASHWDTSLFNELPLADDEEEGDEEFPTAKTRADEDDDLAAMITAAFNQLVETSGEYRSATADWNQKEAHAVVLKDFNEAWATENLTAQYLLAIVTDKDGNTKSTSNLIDLIALDEENAEMGIDPAALSRYYEIKLYAPVEPTDKLLILNQTHKEDEAAGSSSDNYVVIDSYLIADVLAGGSIACQDPDRFTCIVEFQDAPWLDAHAGMQHIYDYYKEVWNRDSYDGEGAPIRQFVNVQDDNGNFDGASQNAAAGSARQGIDAKMPGMGQYAFDFMYYGCGDDTAVKTVVAFDIMAHEYTHLVTAYNGNGGLEGPGETGALNEAYSDIMACAIGHATGLDTNWTIGENVMTGVMGDYIRSLAEPKSAKDPQPDTYGGENWADTEDLSEEGDEGGVHANCGVMNHWFYLLSEGGKGTNDLGYSYDLQPLGIEKAAAIAFSTLLHALTPTVKYQDVCDATTLTAKNLYGESEAIAVAEAWKAVGLTVTDGIITGIEEINSQLSILNSQLIYNLSGQRVGNDYKGIAVKRGKKIILK